MNARETPVGEFFGDVTPLWGAQPDQDHPLAEAISQALSDLEADEIEMVMLHINGFSVRDIAELMGTNKSRIHRALPELMKRVSTLLRGNEEITNHVHGRRDDGSDSDGGVEASESEEPEG